MDTTQLTRRDFLATTALATGSALVSKTFAQEAAQPGIRVACCSANFHGFRGGVDPLPAIELIGGMGFDGIELIALALGDLTTIWSGAKLDAIRAALTQHKLAVSRFGVFGPFLDNIFSNDHAKRDANLDAFDKACAVAKLLGATQMGCVGTSVPGTNSFLYQLPKDAAQGSKIMFTLPAKLDWPALWSRAVVATKALVERAKAHGLTLCIEPHFNGIPQTAEQFLLLQKEVNDPALGYLLDSCWTSIQCAYPPLLAHMMGPHITNVQFRDCDATTRNHSVPFGKGAVDFPALLAALKAVNYCGFVSLEEYALAPKQKEEDAKNFLAFMRAELAKA